jgi:hypothetical protein
MSADPPAPEPVFDATTSALDQAQGYIDWVRTLPANQHVNFPGSATRADFEVMQSTIDLITAVAEDYLRERLIKDAVPLFAGATVKTWKTSIEKAHKERLRQQRQGARADMLNAHVFVQVNGERLKFCSAWDVWVTWTGKLWARDDCGAGQ